MQDLLRWCTLIAGPFLRFAPQRSASICANQHRPERRPLALGKPTSAGVAASNDGRRAHEPDHSPRATRAVPCPSVLLDGQPALSSALFLQSGHIFARHVVLMPTFIVPRGCVTFGVRSRCLRPPLAVASRRPSLRVFRGNKDVVEFD